MHSSILTILAAGSLYLTSCSAAPTNSSSTPGIGATVKHLDSNGMLHWTPAANGGRTTIIAPGLVAHAHTQLATGGSRKLKPRGGPSADVGGFTNIGQIANYAASYACEQSGAYGVSTTIDTYIAPACTSLVGQVPGVPIAETAWSIYQAAAAPGADGNQVATIFRFFTNTAAAPTLTESICNTAFTDLTSTFCQGKGDHDQDTQGGEVKVGTGNDYLMIGFDPNDV
ncbi:MAG: hypothetical protein Q9161_001458 [Pseudevernia consocians]